MPLSRRVVVLIDQPRSSYISVPPTPILTGENYIKLLFTAGLSILLSTSAIVTTHAGQLAAMPEIATKLHKMGNKLPREIVGETF